VGLEDREMVSQFLEEAEDFCLSKNGQTDSGCHRSLCLMAARVFSLVVYRWPVTFIWRFLSFQKWPNWFWVPQTIVFNSCQVLFSCSIQVASHLHLVPRSWTLCLFCAMYMSGVYSHSFACITSYLANTT